MTRKHLARRRLWTGFALLVLAGMAMAVIIGARFHDPTAGLGSRPTIAQEKSASLTNEERLFTVIIDGKYGFINASGELVIPALYEHAAPESSEGLIAVKMGGKDGYINTQGEVVIPGKYVSAGEFHEGRAVVFAQGGWGYIDKEGVWITRPIFDAADKFRNGVARVCFETLWSRIRGNFMDVGIDCHDRYIDRDGKYVSTRAAKRLYEREPTFPAKRWVKGKVGYADADGVMVIRAEFDDGKPFTEGLAAVKLDGKWGYIDESGRFVIEPSFGSVFQFSHGLAKVPLDGEYEYINRSGEIIWPRQK